ncbi:heme exporter protein CcmB [uncultured Umboniibacter sp.]|uniref:heme exporter protein CcmB n=1 Tax=uncultured Umboniibacter sp. TaxID=1798917 RepID=UPI0026139909|nr:heme exporter protein CcmB [uncultured Umboniibacter sp.]
MRLSMLAKRDFTLYWRNKSDVSNALIFFVVAVSFFPLGVSPEAAVLGPISIGLIWIVALLSVQLGLDSLFRDDYEDGSLEQLALSETPLALIVLVRLLVYWCCVGLPLSLFSPLLGLMLSMPAEAYSTLILSITLGTLYLTAVGAVGAALTVSLKRGGMLMSLIVMPLYTPILIFGSSSVSFAANGLDANGLLLVVFGLTVLSVSLAPLAISASLRMSLENG